MAERSGEASALRVSEASYGPEYRDHLLQQYRLYVESADRVSDRRATANNLLLAVNSFLLTFYGFARVWLDDLASGDDRAWEYLVPIAGVLVSVMWWALIRSYRLLNRTKFSVVHELESLLPAALFDREWELADEGKTWRNYVPLTQIEQFIPVVFAVLYLALATSAVID